MLHSQILASNFIKNYNPVPWFGAKQYIEILFQQFSNITTYIRVVENMLDQHYRVLFVSNPGDKLLKSRKTMGQIRPYFQQ